MSDKRMEGHIHRNGFIWKTFIYFELLPIPLDYLLLLNGKGWNGLAKDKIAVIGLIALCLFCHLMPLWDRLFGFIGLLDKKFVMDEDGVTYHAFRKDLYIPWKEVRQVVLYPNKLGQYNKHCFLCFIAAEQAPLGPLDWRKFTNEWLGVQYRPKLLPFIQEHATNARLTDEWASSIREQAGGK